MRIKRFITDLIPPLKTSDTAERALQWMNEFRLDHLPVIENKKFIGIISENEIRKQPDVSKPISSYLFKYDRVFIFEKQYIFDALRFVSDHKLAIIPVLSSDENYMGLLTVIDLIDYISELTSVKLPGGVVVLEVDSNDYSMAEIAQVIESNEGKILSASVTRTPDPGKMEVTIKVDKVDLSRLLAAMYRLNFNVTATYHQSEFSGDLQDRYDSFMNYMNV